MRYRTILLIILTIFVVIVLFGLGIGFLIAFIKDKGGDNYFWAALIILVVLSAIYLVSNEMKIKKELTRKKSQYLELGKLFFKNYTNDFEIFYKAFLQADNKKRRPIEVLHEFADKKGLSLSIDWKGEENEGEIQDFINSQIDKTITWINTTKLREKNTEDTASDGKFIIRLFKAIDRDLKEIDKKLLFFDLGTDSYFFSVTNTTTFKDITKIESNDFHGTEKLKP